MQRFRRTAALLATLALAVAVGAGVVDYERNPVRTHPAAGTQTSGPLQILLKLRPATGTSQAGAPAAPERLKSLATRTGVTLGSYRRIAGSLHALHVEPVAGDSVEQTLARLRADPDVEYADVSQMRYIHATIPPNDPLYASQGALTDPGQWYLMPPASAGPAAVDAQTAWATTTGSATMVIADIDTGVLPHPDLVGNGTTTNRLLAGYCFISNSFIANGGACPGPGATDPGDWVTSTDITDQPSLCGGSGATAEPSSWHGTRTAGLMGAIANNGIGIAGITWQPMILPVRAIGKCGGEDADIVQAMLWAAGLPVANPQNANGPDITNPNPARVINMSIGGSGNCPSTYSDAISQITARGILIVVSAGNASGPVEAPGNCPGVVGVAGLRQAGTKVGYSSFGPEVSVGAPAGNCYYTAAGEPCLYSVTTTTNLGTTTPVANDYTGLYYCDGTANNPNSANCTVPTNGTEYRTYNLGTSFSAPIVSGIGALMAAANPNLNTCQLVSRLKEGSVAYPQYTSAAPPGDTTQPPACSNSNSSSVECICTTDGQTCGAGMANAPGALKAALRPIAAVALPNSVSAGASIQLDASGSAAAPSNSIASYAWTSVGGQNVTITNASSSSATVTAPSCGLATVQLVVTDDTGATDTADVVLSPTSATSSAPSNAGPTSSCSFTAPAVEVAVCPATASAQAGSGSQTFTATLANTANTAVTWQVNGIDGGNATVGTITSAGVYTAPANVPTPATVTVTAISSADSSVTASTNLTVTAPPATHGGGALDLLSLLVAGGALAAARRARRQGRPTLTMGRSRRH